MKSPEDNQRLMFPINTMTVETHGYMENVGIIVHLGMVDQVHFLSW